MSKKTSTTSSDRTVARPSATGTGTITRRTGTVQQLDGARGRKPARVAESDAIHPDLSRTELRALLRAAVTGHCRRAIAQYLGIALLRGPVDRALGAWLAMYSDVLDALCRMTSFSEDAAYRLDANAKLPRVAATMLLQELQLGGKLPQIELTMIQDALELLQRRRGKPTGYYGGKPAGTAPAGTAPAAYSYGDIPPGSRMPLPPPPWPSEMSAVLGLRLNVDASAIVAQWEASPPAPEQAVDIAELWLEFGDRSGIVRKTEWSEWRQRLKRAGRSCPMLRFYEEAGVTHSRFHEGWLGRGIWPDDCESAQRVLEVMARPVTSWPLKPRRGRGH